MIIFIVKGLNKIESTWLISPLTEVAGSVGCIRCILSEFATWLSSPASCMAGRSKVKRKANGTECSSPIRRDVFSGARGPRFTSMAFL